MVSLVEEEAADTPPVVAPFRLRSDFKPINSRGKALDLFQKSLKNNSLDWHLVLVIEDTSTVIILLWRSAMLFLSWVGTPP